MTGDVAPDLSVVICSRNGEAGVARCIESLRRQTGDAVIEVIVVDDGSTDDTAARARRLGARVLQHEQNLGIGAARNTGAAAARAGVVAYLDDDCEVHSDWAQSVLRVFQQADCHVLVLGGAVVPETPPGIMRGYLGRNNPLVPLELDLAEDDGLPYRLLRYLVRSWSARPSEPRFVFALPAASMCVRTSALWDVGGFDATLRFGPEDLDLCMRLRRRFGDRSLWFDPGVAVVHHFGGRVRDSMRRSRAYGEGHARLLRKHDDVPPTVFPLPLVLAGLVLVGARRPALLALAVVLPHLVHPRGIRQVPTAGLAVLLDAYLTVLLETQYVVGAFGPGSGTLPTLAARHRPGRWTA